MKLTTSKLKQIIKEELKKITEARDLSDIVPGSVDDPDAPDPDYGDTIPGLGYGKAPQDAFEPNAPGGITVDQREQLEYIIGKMTRRELEELMRTLDPETKDTLRKYFIGRTGRIPDPYNLER